MSHRDLGLTRRHFLLTFGAGSAAAAATIATRARATEPLAAAASPPDAQRTRGYRESAHIARYYRSARI